jgi:nitrogen fixation/metabolism regulation signal transduction histidine kinase
VNQVIKDVSGLYENSQVKISYDLAANLPDLMGDSTMLRQVLHNLMQNAQDALVETESPEIIVKTTWNDTNVNLQVKDNGQGFPEDVLAHAYEPYVTTKAHGTGLGLAIVKKMVEEHFGQIKIENTPSGGACITIQLPLAHDIGLESKKQIKAK